MCQCQWREHVQSLRPVKKERKKDLLGQDRRPSRGPEAWRRHCRDHRTPYAGEGDQGLRRRIGTGDTAATRAMTSRCAANLTLYESSISKMLCLNTTAPVCLSLLSNATRQTPMLISSYRKRIIRHPHCQTRPSIRRSASNHRCSPSAVMP